jgi:hypothetical protein
MSRLSLDVEALHVESFTTSGALSLTEWGASDPSVLGTCLSCPGDCPTRRTCTV